MSMYLHTRNSIRRQVSFYTYGVSLDAVGHILGDDIKAVESSADVVKLNGILIPYANIDEYIIALTVSRNAKLLGIDIEFCQLYSVSLHGDHFIVGIRNEEDRFVILYGGQHVVKNGISMCASYIQQVGDAIYIGKEGQSVWPPTHLKEENV